MEVGVKGELADGHANGSIGIFEIKQDKVAQPLAQPDGAHRVPGTTTQAYSAARGATSGGIEGELSGRLALGWSVTASASHFRAKDREQQDINTLLPRSTARLLTTWTVQPGLTVGGPGHQPISTFARSNTPRRASAWEDIGVSVPSDSERLSWWRVEIPASSHARQAATLSSLLTPGPSLHRPPVAAIFQLSAARFTAT